MCGTILWLKKSRRNLGADKLDTLWRENIDLVHVVTGKRTLEGLEDDKDE